MHPLFGEAKKSHSAKHSRLARGGDAAEDAAMIRSAVAQHEKADHPGKPLTPIKLRKEGGSVEGAMSKPRNDRLARASGGGAKKKGGGGKTHVNVIIAPQGGGAHPPMPGPLGAPPGGLPPGMPVHPPGPPMAPPGPPPMAGPGGPPGMPPPGGMPPRPPMMPPPGMPPRYAGGGVGYKKGGAVSESSRKKEQMGPYGRKHGGGVESYENKAPSEQGVGEVGSGSGLGRLAKAKSYGEPAPKGGK